MRKWLLFLLLLILSGCKEKHDVLVSMPETDTTQLVEIKRFGAYTGPVAEAKPEAVTPAQQVTIKVYKAEKKEYQQQEQNINQNYYTEESTMDTPTEKKPSTRNTGTVEQNDLNDQEVKPDKDLNFEQMQLNDVN